MDRELAKLVGGLPDSRPRESRGEIRSPRGNAVPVFCLSCGKPEGYALVGTGAIVRICEECEGRHGGLPLPVVDDRIVRGG